MSDPLAAEDRPDDLSPADRAKRAAAARAVEMVEDGMKLGLGTGSTASWMVRLLAERVRSEGLRLACVPTSARTAAQAEGLGLTVTTLDAAGWLDLTIDGADEADPALDLIKGGGGALLLEKIVATASDRMVAIAEAGKDVARLGAFPLPVEVTPFGRGATRALIARALEGFDLDGRDIVLRMAAGAGGAAYVTDEGNNLFDLHLGRIGDAGHLNAVLNCIPGVVETGLFVGICDRLILGHADGTTTERDRGQEA
jgi:ribose 5-phosphate isomerase A